MLLAILYIFLFCVFFTNVTYGQQINQSVILTTEIIPYNEFNKNQHDSFNELGDIYSINWQIMIANELSYESGDAVIRFYDNNDHNKFIEIGMGEPPNNKLWIAVWLPDYEYTMIHKKLEHGWISNSNIILSYTEHIGLTINNGERIIVSNLDIGNFNIAGYSSYGIQNLTEKLNINEGQISFELISGDPAQNPLHMLPFFLVGFFMTIIVLLLITKHRS